MNTMVATKIALEANKKGSFFAKYGSKDAKHIQAIEVTVAILAQATQPSCNTNAQLEAGARTHPVGVDPVPGSGS